MKNRAAIKSKRNPLKERRFSVIRQDRRNVEDLNFQIESASTSCKVINVGPFGLLVEHENPISTPISECVLKFEDIELGHLNLRLLQTDKNLRLLQTDKSQPASSYRQAYEILGPPLDLSQIDGLIQASQVIAKFTRHQKDTEKISNAFARKVYELKDWLEHLQREINSIETEEYKINPPKKVVFEKNFIQKMSNYLDSIIPTKNDELSHELKDVKEHELQNYCEFFREKLKSLIYEAPFSRRAYLKPFGYAGDFEMMNFIYKDSQPMGDTLFAKCMHAFWIKQPAAQAVRNRATFIRSKIEKTLASAGEELRFLSVACGPALEWQEFLKQNPVLKTKKIIVDLLDQDEQALKHAQLQIYQQLKPTHEKIQFNFIHQTIKDVIDHGLENTYDLIYSAGLFDYFPDPIARRAASRLFKKLNAGGTLIIGNFSLGNPNSIGMGIILNWHLIYRSKTDLQNLYASLGGRIDIESEELGINLFCIVHRNS